MVGGGKPFPLNALPAISKSMSKKTVLDLQNALLWKALTSILLCICVYEAAFGHKMCANWHLMKHHYLLRCLLILDLLASLFMPQGTCFLFQSLCPTKCGANKVRGCGAPNEPGQLLVLSFNFCSIVFLLALALQVRRRAAPRGSGGGASRRPPGGATG